MMTRQLLPDAYSDFAAASAVLDRLMRNSTPGRERLEYSAQCRQRGGVGGDFYSFLPGSDGRMAFAIGDASGKGIAAALMSAGVQSSLRTATACAQMAPSKVAAMIKSPNLCILTAGPVRHSLLWCLR